MTNYTTTTRKGFDGIRAETIVELGDCVSDSGYGNGKRVLKFTTSKTGTLASVSEEYGQASCSALCQDYFKTVTRNRVARATEKAILAAHNAAMPEFAAHIKAARKQYNVTYAVEHNGDFYQSVFPEHEAAKSQNHTTFDDAVHYMVNECGIDKNIIEVK